MYIDFQKGGEWAKLLEKVVSGSRGDGVVGVALGAICVWLALIHQMKPALLYFLTKGGRGHIIKAVFYLL